MKKLIFPALIGLAITTSAFTVVNNATTWNVKGDSYSVKFTSSKFDGAFKGLKSEFVLDETNLSNSKLSASIDATSVNTGNGMRNKHAQQGLEAKTYKTVKFVSTAFTKTDNGYQVTGNLTIKDVSKQIKIPFTFNKKDDERVFAGTFSVKPSEYNVTKSGTPEVLNFQINVPYTK